jgi:hypothetical protein
MVLATRSVSQQPADGNVAISTFKYDNQRTGANTSETMLNVDNVGSDQFGRLMSYGVDGQIYAQPLYMPDVDVHGTSKDLVFVATENDSVYAFDADHYAHNGPVWHTRFAVGGAQPVPATDMRCNDLAPEVGITSTPVIANQTLFVVSHTVNRGRFLYQLHALNLSNGHELPGSPAEVDVPDSVFTARMERQRAALLYADGHIYMAFSSFCDNGSYHGWIIGYTYNGHSFARVASWNDTPGGREGGLWGGGGALAADQRGFIYATTGNGTFNLSTGGPDAGDSYVKLNAHLQVKDYFTPFDQQCLNADDGDLGSGGPLLLPGNEMTSGTKDGKIYVVSTTHMGHYTTVRDACSREQATNVDRIVQELPLHTMGSGVYSVPAYWNGYVYYSGSKGYTKAFQLQQGRLVGPVSATEDKIGYTGGNPTISSDGDQPGTGILWLIDGDGTLRAYDATNLGHELYAGELGSYIKFTAPVVSNGRVFVPTANALEIFGLANDASFSATNTRPATPLPDPTSA